MRATDSEIWSVRAVRRLDFDAYLRSGGWPNRAPAGQKFNPYHDPGDGRFTFAPHGREMAWRLAGHRPKASATLIAD